MHTSEKHIITLTSKAFSIILFLDVTSAKSLVFLPLNVIDIDDFYYSKRR
jgi:hypothetical protein